MGSVQSMNRLDKGVIHVPVGQSGMVQNFYHTTPNGAQFKLMNCLFLGFFHLILQTVIAGNLKLQKAKPWITRDYCILKTL